MINRLKSILILTGILNSSYLLLIHQLQTNCATVSHCRSVLNSAYSTVLGIPISAIGLGGLVILLYTLVTERKNSFLVVSSSGAVISILLSISQLTLTGWCLFCLISAAIWISLSGLAWFSRSNRITFNQLKTECSVDSLFIVALISIGSVTFPIMTDHIIQTTRDPIAVQIGEKAIRLADIDAQLGAQMSHLHEQANALRKQWVFEQLITAECAIMKTTPQNLLQSIISSSNLSTNEAIDQLQSNLEKKYSVNYSLPVSSTVLIPENPFGSPILGPSSAPVKLVIFSDLQCPACKTVDQLVHQLIAEFPETIQVTFRHFPLSRHPLSLSAAKAATCAQKQDQFWSFTRLVFDHQDTLSNSSWVTYAEALNLNVTQFKSCLGNATTMAHIEADINQATALGITQTPSIFINNHYTTHLSKSMIVGVIEANKNN